MASRKIFFGKRYLLLSQNYIYFFPDQHLYFVKNMIIYTYLTAYRLYMICRFYQIVLRVNHFYTNRERCEVLTAAPAGGDWANMFYNLLFKQEVVANTVTFTFSSLSQSSSRYLLEI